MRTALPVVNCDGCGVCCLEQGGLPVVWYAGVYRLGDLETLPQELREELDATLAEWRKGHVLPDGSPCVWYDVEAKRCRHYEHRPEVCREHEVGGRSCLSWRRRYRVGTTDSGANS